MAACASGDPSVVEENVVIDSRNVVYGSAVSRGIMGTNVAVAGSEFRYNVVSGWTEGPIPNGIFCENCVTGTVVHHNVFYNYPRCDSGGLGYLTFRDNDVQSFFSPDDTYWLIGDFNLRWTAMADNRYWRDTGASTWFRGNGGSLRTFAQYMADKSDTTSVVEEVAYPDPGRDFARYWTEVCGGSDGMDGLYAAIRLQRKGAWDHRIEPKHMVAWIGAGYGMDIGEALPSSGSESKAKRSRHTVSIGVGL